MTLCNFRSFPKLLHFGKIPKKIGQNLARFNKNSAKIQQNSGKICKIVFKKSAKFQQFFTKKLRLENVFPTLSQLPIISGALTFRCCLNSSRKGTGVCNRPSEEHLKAKRLSRISRIFLMHFSTNWRTWTRIAATAYSTDNICFQKVPRRFLRKGKARARKWSDLPRES